MTKHPDGKQDNPDQDSRDTAAPSPSRPAVAGDNSREVSTTFAQLPQFDTQALLPETEGRLLTALKDQIEQLVIESAGSGIRHEDGRYVVLPKTLRSAWVARVSHPLIGDLRFLIGQTRSIWVLLYDSPYEKVYEDPRFLGIDLKKRDVALTPKGKRMYVSRVERADLDKLNHIAAQDAGERARPDTLAPVEGAFSSEDTMALLRQCTLEMCTDPDFDLASFIESIYFMTPTQGPTGNYYHLETGDSTTPLVCQLHVGTDPQLDAAVYTHRAALSSGDEKSYLYIDVRY